MKKILSLIFIFSILMSSLIFSAKRKTIAIMDFTDSGADIKGMNNMVRGRFEELLYKLQRLNLVERDKIQAVLQEQNFSASGVVDEGTAAQLGGLLGVQFMMFGDIVQGTITPPEDKSKWTYRRVKTGTVNGKPTYKSVKDKFVTWKEIRAIAKISIKIINVEDGTIKYTKTYTGTKIQKLEQKTWNSEADYQRAKRMEQRAAFWDAYILKAGATAEDLSSENKALLAAALENAAGRFKRDLAFEFPLEGVILQVVDKKTVLIDIGTKDGGIKGTKFEVYIVNKMKHPTTGKMMTQEKKLDGGSLKIKEVQGEEMSKCEGGKGLIKNCKPGMVVRSKKQLIVRTK